MAAVRLLDRWTILRHRGRGTRRRGAARAAAAVLALTMTGGAAYTVTAGDTLSRLANKFSTTVAEIAAANGIENPDRIYVGQTLTIPGADGSTPEAPASTPAEGGTHVVSPGESLATIARSYGLSVAELARANGIVDPNRVLAGSLLRIAKDAPPPPGTAEGGSGEHVVARGESLSAIAGRYGTTISAIVEANGLTNPDRIIAGQKLTIPGADGATGWVCPVGEASFINDFGVGKPDGRHHEGIDLFAPHGTVVRAPVAGTVEQVEGNRGGLQFYLTGQDGYTYIGTHLDAFGESGRVAAGAPLGLVGTSGNAVGGPPHVHFEMHYGGVVNPYPTLLEACGG